jgi:hypothetical protein
MDHVVGNMDSRGGWGGRAGGIWEISTYSAELCYESQLFSMCICMCVCFQCWGAGH